MNIDYQAVWNVASPIIGGLAGWLAKRPVYKAENAGLEAITAASEANETASKVTTDQIKDLMGRVKELESNYRQLFSESLKQQKRIAQLESALIANHIAVPPPLD